MHIHETTTSPDPGGTTVNTTTHKNQSIANTSSAPNRNTPAETNPHDDQTLKPSNTTSETKTTTTPDPGGTTVNTTTHKNQFIANTSGAPNRNTPAETNPHDDQTLKPSNTTSETELSDNLVVGTARKYMSLEYEKKGNNLFVTRIKIRWPYILNCFHAF